MPYISDKKVFSTRIDQDRIKDLKHPVVVTGKSLSVLLEEAIKDLVKNIKRINTHSASLDTPFFLTMFYETSFTESNSRNNE